MIPIRNLFRVVLLLWGLGMMMPGVAGAASFNWTNTSGGIWSVGSNWSPVGIPTSTDQVFFSLNNTYTVTFTSSVTTQTFDVQTGTVTFAMSGETYATTTTQGRWIRTTRH